MHSRDVLHSIYLDTHHIRDWIKFKEASTLVKVTLNNDEQDYIRNEVHSLKDNPGSLWKIIKSSIPSKEQESQVYNKDPEEMANEFNHFFASVGKNAAESAAQLATTIDTNVACDIALARNC